MVLLKLDDFGWQHVGLKEKMIRRRNIQTSDTGVNFPTMIEAVRYGTFDAKVKALQSFTDFVCRSDDYDPREIVACGLIPEFVDLLRFEKSQDNASIVLMNLAASSYVAYELTETGVIKQLMKNVTQVESEELISRMLYVISNTAVESDTLCTAIVEMGLWDVIFSIYQKRPHGRHVAALAMNISIVLKNRTIEQDIQKQVFQIINNLLQQGETIIYQSAIESVSHLCTNSEQIQAIIDSNLLKDSFTSFLNDDLISKLQVKIMKRVTSNGSDTQKKYLFSITNFSTFKDLFKRMAEHVKYQQHCLSIICSMLEVTDLSTTLLSFILTDVVPYIEDANLKTYAVKCITNALSIGPPSLLDAKDMTIAFTKLWQHNCLDAILSILSARDESSRKIFIEALLHVPLFTLNQLNNLDDATSQFILAYLK